ncbi:hypothetical protein [Pleomorphochaeta sp. DL1XJH-081]|uniref:hypothetical protein n=1 Tax=Pleomorphochaeta sp. DL1XJH-081 TaxID=3409690 RepID=UPI003BB490DE
MNEQTLTNQKNKQLWVGALSQPERKMVLDASKVCGLRKSEFYRRAIIEKAQSVLSSVNNETQEASSVREQPRVGDASFLSEEKHETPNS